MASQLAQTAKAVRVSIFGLFAFLVLYLIFSQVFSFLGKVVSSKRRPVEPPPTVAFGKLPRPNLKSLVLEGSPAFRLETVSGSLPNFTKKAEVYRLIEPKASLLSLERTKGLAKKLEFQSIATEISPTTYQWQENDGRTLKANTISGNFSVDIDLSALTLSIGDLPSPGEIQNIAKSYLEGRGLLKSLFGEGNPETTLVKKSEATLLKALSLSEANLARVDFFRLVPDPFEKEGLKALPPNPREGLIEVYYTSSKPITFPRIKYFVWEYDFENGETYPLRSVETAWEEIRSGRGSAAFLQYEGSDSLETLPSLSASEVTIRKVYLSYFDDENIQKFLQPIFVFEGDGKDGQGRPIEVIIYFPAVDPLFIE